MIENKKAEIQEMDDQKHPYIGTTVGQYRIDELIGGGAMGLVFKAHQKSIGRDVAIKFLSYHHKGDEVSQKRMKREARAMGKLNHPGLVSTHEFGMTDYGQPYIVMEYLKGEPLCDLLSEKGILEKNRAVHFAKQIAEAMDYAHRNGVIHRDLKPANIMVTIEPWIDHLKIYDFGIARLTADSQFLTRPGMAMGSPAYMSPEQCKGLETDCRSDIYSLGVILYSSISGTFPVFGDGGQMTMLNKIKFQPTMISEYVPDIHPALELLIMSMLAIDPILRPQTMSHVVRDLERIMEAKAYKLSSNKVKQLISSSNETSSQNETIQNNQLRPKKGISSLFETNTNQKEKKALTEPVIAKRAERSLEFSHTKNQFTNKTKNNSPEYIVSGLVSTIILTILGVTFYCYSQPEPIKKNNSAIEQLNKIAQTAGAEVSISPLVKQIVPQKKTENKIKTASKKRPKANIIKSQKAIPTARISHSLHQKKRESTIKKVSYHQSNQSYPSDRLRTDQKLQREFQQFLRFKAQRLEKQKRRQSRFRRGSKPSRPMKRFGPYANTPYNQIHNREFLRAQQRLSP